MGAFDLAWSLLKTIDADEEWYSYGGGKGSHYNAEDDVDYFASSPCPSCGGTEGFSDDPEDVVFHWCGHSADKESICGDCHSPITGRNPQIDAIKTPENAQHIKALRDAKKVYGGPAGCFNCLEQHRLTGKLPHTPIQQMMGYEYNPDVHWRVEDLKDNDSELFRASSDVFEEAWSLLKDMRFTLGTDDENRGPNDPALTFDFKGDQPLDEYEDEDWEAFDPAIQAFKDAHKKVYEIGFGNISWDPDNPTRILDLLRWWSGETMEERQTEANRYNEPQAKAILAELRAKLMSSAGSMGGV